MLGIRQKSTDHAMSTNQHELRERYSQMTIEELIELHNRGTLTDFARPFLVSELRLRGVNPEQVRSISIKTPQQIDKEVFKERGKAAIATVLWRLFWRLVVPVSVIFAISYALRFWDWITH